MTRPKPSAMSIQAFHAATPGAEPPPDEVLPEAPCERADDDSSGVTRKWVVGVGLDRNSTSAPLGGATGGASQMPLDAYKSALDGIIAEFLSNRDIGEAARSIAEANSPAHAAHIVKRAVTRALDGAGKEKEGIAVLLASLHARGHLPTPMVADGFRLLAEGLEELTLDCPDALCHVAHFLADSILEGMLERSDVDGWPADVLKAPPAADLVAAVDARLRSRQPVGGSARRPVRDVRAVRAEIRPVLVEYLISRDADEVGRRCAELGLAPDQYRELVRVAVELAIDRKDPEREATCRLLSDMADAPTAARRGRGCAGLLTRTEIAAGFELLLARVHDLAVDNPSAPALLASFLVRAISDDLVPPAFVRAPIDALSTAEQRDALTHARAQLAAAHSSGPRTHVWGLAADASVPSLKKAVKGIVDEYLNSADIAEAARSARELQAPAFMHEMVKRLVVTALDKSAKEVRRPRATLPRDRRVRRLPATY